MPAARIAASPEQIETQIEPSSQTAPIAPEKINTASVERHDALLSSDEPLRATAKIVPLPVPRPGAVAKASASKTAVRVATPDPMSEPNSDVANLYRSRTRPSPRARRVPSRLSRPPIPKAEGVSVTHWEIYYAVYLATLENPDAICAVSLPFTGRIPFHEPPRLWIAARGQGCRAAASSASTALTQRCRHDTKASGCTPSVRAMASKGAIVLSLWRTHRLLRRSRTGHSLRPGRKPRTFTDKKAPGMKSTWPHMY